MFVPNYLQPTQMVKASSQDLSFSIGQHRVPSGSLLLFDAASSLWSSKDQGRSWSKVAQKLPFGQGTEQAVLVTVMFFFHVLIGPSENSIIMQAHGLS